MVLDAIIDMKGISHDGDAIVIDTLVERSKFFAALGVTEARYRPGTRLVVRNGCIASTQLTALDQGSANQGREKYQDLMRWLAANRPEDQKRLFSSGRITRRDAATAHLLLEVIEQWQKSKP